MIIMIIFFIVVVMMMVVVLLMICLMMSLRQRYRYWQNDWFDWQLWLRWRIIVISMMMVMFIRTFIIAMSRTSWRSDWTNWSYRAWLSRITCITFGTFAAAVAFSALWSWIAMLARCTILTFGTSFALMTWIAGWSGRTRWPRWSRRTATMLTTWRRIVWRMRCRNFYYLRLDIWISVIVRACYALAPGRQKGRQKCCQ